MSGSKPPPRTHAPEEERKIQQFLERAAPIVLECRVLDTQHWKLLSDLAEELDLNRAQLRETVEDLRQRGVIEKIDIRPPTPPPLPHPTRSDDSSASDAIDAEFALTAPPPAPGSNSQPQPVPQPPSSRPAAVRAEPATTRSSEPTDPAPTDGENRARFARRVQEIVAEHRGMSAKAHTFVAAAAREFGIPDHEVKALIRGETPADQEDMEGSKHRWRVLGQPAPEPPRAKSKPSETFRSFVGASLERLSGKNVAPETEKSIVKHGVKVLRLSEIYARHLLLDVAAEKGLTVDSQGKAQPQEPAPEIPPEHEEFGARAASILAEHRGITAKSRVLLTALGREYELSSDEVERLISSMLKKGESQSDSLEQDRQQQRLVSFKKGLRSTLKKLPRKILLPNTAETLVEQGQDRYGLDKELVTEALDEAVQELQLVAISSEEATEHISGLIDLMLGNGLRLRGEHRNRVFSEASQWGVSPERVEKLLSDRSRENYLRRRAEQKWANVALVGAASALTLVLGFGAWTILKGVTPEPPAPEKPNAVEQLQEVDRVTNRDRDWWSGELAIALFNCETEFPAQTSMLEEIASRDPRSRSKAYRALVAEFFDPATENGNWQDCLTMFAHCYALDPDNEAATELGEALLELVPGPADGIAPEPQRYPQMFWRLRVAVAALAQCVESGSDSARTSHLATSISQKIGAGVDETLPAEELEHRCLGVFCESLMKSLTDYARSEPMVPPALHEAIASEAADHLDRVLLDHLNADFLVALLSEASDGWEDYQGLMAQTIRSGEPLVVAKVVEVFQTTTNRDLQDYMNPLLVERTGIVPKSGAAPELAEQFLKSLGVRADATIAGRQRQFQTALKRTLRGLKTSPQSEVLLNGTSQLARLTTLATALSQGDVGSDKFRELLEKGPIKLADEADGAERERTIADPGTLRRVGSHLEVLEGTRKRDQSKRISQFASLAALADRLLDVPMPHSGKLADYLVRTKHKEEHDQTMARIGNMGNWPSLALAVADRLPGRLDADRARELVESLTGTKLELPDNGAMQLDVLRFALLGQAQRDVPASDAGDTFEAARSALYREHLDQLEILGGTRPFDVAESDKTVSTALKALIRFQANRLRRVRNAEKPQPAGEIERELTAIHHWAENDLYETAHLQRVWLRLLAAEAAVKSPDRVATLLADLERNDAEARSVLEQMRGGQRAIALAWSLIAWPGVEFK